MLVNTDQRHASIALFQSKPSLKTSSKFRVLRQWMERQYIGDFLSLL